MPLQESLRALQNSLMSEYRASGFLANALAMTPSNSSGNFSSLRTALNFIGGSVTCASIKALCSSC